jgi:hypothetical protein
MSRTPRGSVTHCTARFRPWRCGRASRGWRIAGALPVPRWRCRGRPARPPAPGHAHAAGHGSRQRSGPATSSAVAAASASAAERCSTVTLTRACAGAAAGRVEDVRTAAFAVEHAEALVGAGGDHRLAALCRQASPAGPRRRDRGCRRARGGRAHRARLPPRLTSASPTPSAAGGPAPGRCAPLPWHRRRSRAAGADCGWPPAVAAHLELRQAGSRVAPARPAWRRRPGAVAQSRRHGSPRPAPAPPIPGLNRPAEALEPRRASGSSPAAPA